MRDRTANICVLIVENNHDSADILKILVELDGYDVRVAYTAKSGLLAIPEYRPDAILCGIYMPEMTELQFAQQVRQTPASRDALLISLDGATSRIPTSKFLEAGFNCLMSKPASFGNVLGKLRSFFTDSVIRSGD